MRYIIGVDIGTSGTKTVLFDEYGRIVRSAYAEYPISQPQNGYAEQDPEDWSRAAIKTIDEVIGDEPISSIGLSGQMHGLVMLDSENRVIRPSIIWCDQRTEPQCRELDALFGRDKLIEVTANPPLTGFTASKILWVKENEPENFAKCKHILLPKDYVRFVLTGEFATDLSDASGMQLLDVPKRKWAYELAEKVGVSRDMLPRLCESTEITGYYKGIPVAAGGGDNACAAVGSGTVASGRAFTTIGTSGVVYAHTDLPIIDPRGRIHTFCSAVPGAWHVMGVTQAAGLSLGWFRKNFAPELSYRELDALCEEIPIGADGLFYLPYLMGERTPHLDPNVRGAFLGISAMHTRAHFVRAVMEGVTYSLRDCLEVFSELGLDPDTMAAVGGGAKSPLWQQLLADVFDTEIMSLDISEGAALGAAILGGVGAGVFESVGAACDVLVHSKAKVLPKSAVAYASRYAVFKTLYDRIK